MAGEPLVMCKYGWRQVVRLYHDNLVVGTTHYALADLIYVRPTCRRLLHKSSLRLELCFKGQVVVLRGIADLDAAQKMLRYLLRWCASFEARERQSPDISAEGCASEKLAQNIPSTDALVGPVSPGALPANNVANTQAQPTPAEHATVDSPLTQQDDLIAQCDTSIIRMVQAPTTRLAETSQTPTWQAHLVQEPAMDAEQIPESTVGALAECSSSLSEQNLPLVQVPLQLLDGESAHYSTPATRCDASFRSTTNYRYRVKDQGILILTNLRMVYLGRKSQVVLNYAHLTHISRQHDTLAFLAEHWTSREVFKVTSPLECATCLTHILRRFKQRSNTLQQGGQQAPVGSACQSIPDTNERELQNRARLADKETQVMMRITGSANVFPGNEQPLEWLSQLYDIH